MTLHARPAGWVRSSRCESSHCVEIMSTSDRIVMRDAKDPGGAGLSFGLPEWRSFLAGVRSDRFVE